MASNRGNDAAKLFDGDRFPWLKCLEIRCILGNLTKKHVVKKSTNPTNHIKSKISPICWQERNIPPETKKQGTQIQRVCW